MQLQKALVFAANVVLIAVRAAEGVALMNLVFDSGRNGAPHLPRDIPTAEWD